MTPMLPSPPSGSVAGSPLCSTILTSWRTLWSCLPSTKMNQQRRSPTKCLQSFLAAPFPILLKAPQTTPSTTITPPFPAYRSTGAFHHSVGGIATPTSSRLWPTRQDMSTMTLTRRTFSSTSLIQALCLTPSIFLSGLRLIHLQSVLPGWESSRRS